MLYLGVWSSSSVLAGPLETPRFNPRQSDTIPSEERVFSHGQRIAGERAAKPELPATAPALDTISIGNTSWIYWRAAKEILYFHQENLPFPMANALQ